MPKIKYISINPKELTLIKSKKEVKVIDPIRYPNIVEPVEKKLADNYNKMLTNMKKMLNVELVKHIIKK
jgi:hypothetical protein